MAGIANPAQAAWRYSVSVSVNTTRLIIGEAVWVTGSVRNTAGNPAPDVKIALQRKPSGGSWSTFAYVTTKSNGKVSYSNRPGKAYAYRAVVRETSKLAQVYSSGKWVSVLRSGSRGLTVRADQLKSVIGSPVSALHTSGLTAWRHYDRGVLVRRGEAGNLRTWLVTGKFYTEYREAGGVTGRLGRPVEDMQCSLIEWGCIQRFVGGTMYYSSTEPTPTVVYGNGRWTEHYAVAKSQVGYVEPSWRHNKYNTWVGGDYAWCSVFQSWVSAASGNGSAVPKAKTYASFLDKLGAAGLYVSRPGPGRLALFDFAHPGGPATTPTHAGFIYKVSGDTLYTIEGNSTYNAGFDGPRQVVMRTRNVKNVWRYANPYGT